MRQKILQPNVSKDEKDKLLQPTQAEVTARKEKQQIVYSGFIAQDVEKTAKEVKYDFSGVDAAKNSKDLYGLRYAEFVVPLVKAVQQLSAQNEEMKKEIEDLKTMISSGAQTRPAPVTDNINSTFDKATLAQNAPNPAHGNTTISYSIPAGVSVASLVISDMSGRVLKTISLSGKGAGQITLNSVDFAAGNYTYTLLADGKRTATKQMMIGK